MLQDNPSSSVSRIRLFMKHVHKQTIKKLPITYLCKTAECIKGKGAEVYIKVTRVR